MNHTKYYRKGSNHFDINMFVLFLAQNLNEKEVKTIFEETQVRKYEN